MILFALLFTHCFTILPSRYSRATFLYTRKAFFDDWLLYICPLPSAIADTFPFGDGFVRFEQKLKNKKRPKVPLIDLYGRFYVVFVWAVDTFPLGDGDVCFVPHAQSGRRNLIRAIFARSRHCRATLPLGESNV